MTKEFDNYMDNETNENESQLDSKANRAGRNKGDALNDRQLAFVENYIVTQNATESYCRAYEIDDRRVASVGATRLMKNERIVKRIEERKAELQNTNRILSPDELLIHLSNILTSPNEKTADRIRAAELIGKHYGAWIDRQEVNSVQDFRINLVGFDGQDEKKMIIEHKPEGFIEYNGEED